MHQVDLGHAWEIGKGIKIAAMYAPNWSGYTGGAKLCLGQSPMRSTFSKDLSSSSRLGKVRQISDEGKGECRKRPQRKRWKRLRSSDGRTSR